MIFMSAVRGSPQDAPVTTTYDPRPGQAVEVLVDDVWRPARLRRLIVRHGAQWATVNYTDGSRNCVAVLPGERVRQPGG